MKKNIKYEENNLREASQIKRVGNCPGMEWNGMSCLDSRPLCLAVGWSR